MSSEDDRDPILARMSQEDRAEYEKAREKGYALLRKAHRLYMDAALQDFIRSERGH